MTIVIQIAYVVSMVASLQRRKTRAETMLETRRRVLDAAAQVFAESGFSGSSVRDVAEAAGFTTGALYAHFATKEELFLAVLEDRYETKIAELTSLVDDSTNGDAALGALQQRFDRLRDAEGEWDLLATEFWLFAARNPGVRPKLAALHKRLRDGVARLIETQLAVYALDAPPDATAVAAAIIAIGDGIGIQARIDPGALPEGLFAKSVLALATAHLATFR